MEQPRPAAFCVFTLLHPFCIEVSFCSFQRLFPPSSCTASSCNRSELHHLYGCPFSNIRCCPCTKAVWPTVLPGICHNWCSCPCINFACPADDIVPVVFVGSDRCCNSLTFFCILSFLPLPRALSGSLILPKAFCCLLSFPWRWHDHYHTYWSCCSPAWRIFRASSITCCDSAPHLSIIAKSKCIKLKNSKTLNKYTTTLNRGHLKSKASYFQTITLIKEAHIN